MITKAKSKVAAPAYPLIGNYPGKSHELRRSMTIAAALLAGLFTLSKAGTLLKGRNGSYAEFARLTDKKAQPFPAAKFDSGEAQVKLQNAMVGKDGSYKGHVETVQAFIKAMRAGGTHTIADSSGRSETVHFSKD